MSTLKVCVAKKDDLSLYGERLAEKKKIQIHKKVIFVLMCIHRGDVIIRTFVSLLFA
jgi:hypothetical protein